MLMVNKYYNNRYFKTLIDNFIVGKFNDNMYLVTGAFLDVVDNINSKEYNGTFTTSLGNGSMSNLIDSMFNGTVTADDLLGDGQITATTGYEIHKFGNYSSSNMSNSFNEDTSVTSIYYSMPLSVGVSGFFQDAAKGTDTEQLYIVFYSGNDAGYWNLVRELSVQQSTYVSFTVTETNGGGDIEFDHIDKIEYVDTLDIKVALPKQIIS